jgi:hypothetical protein
MKSLSFIAGGQGQKGMNETIDEELLTNRSGSTRITGSLTRPQVYSVGPNNVEIMSNSIEQFLLNISPELRKVV